MGKLGTKPRRRFGSRILQLMGSTGISLGELVTKSGIKKRTLERYLTLDKPPRGPRAEEKIRKLEAVFNAVVWPPDEAGGRPDMNINDDRMRGLGIGGGQIDESIAIERLERLARRLREIAAETKGKIDEVVNQAEDEVRRYRQDVQRRAREKVVSKS